MPTLPPEWHAHFEAGVAVRVGACNRAGQPSICRAQAAALQADGRVCVWVAPDAGQPVLAAVRETGQVAVTLGLPSTHRTLHIKGRDAVVAPGQADHDPLLAQRFEAFAAQLRPFGVAEHNLRAAWIEEGARLMTLSFHPSGAWNQSPGPGAGEALELR